MRMIKKNMDIAGVSQALKKLSTKTTTHTPTSQFVENDERLMDNNVTINPSNELCGQQCSDNEKVASESENTIKYACGWFNFRPAWIQKFMTVQWCLVFLCLAGALQGLVINGLLNTVISSIERRFGLQSKQTGFIASGYDIASFFCLIPVSYYGGRVGASKLKWVGTGIIIMGLGFFIFALPHFLVDSYRANTLNEQIVCGSKNANNETIVSCTSNQKNGIEDISWNFWFFFIAQILHGIGASPLYTLGVTYIDENVSRKMSSVYLGIFYCMAILGPAVGYLLGGQILLIYTDLGVDPSTFGLTPESKLWIGAWYLGFLIFAFVSLFIAVPLIAFPSKLPGSEKLEKISEAHNDGIDDEIKNQAFTKLNEIPKAFYLLIKNPSYLFLNLAGASEGLIISGFAVFSPKQIENQYSVSAVYAALLMGIIIIPAGGGGTFFGGYLVKKLKLSCSGTMKFCMIVSMFAALFTVSFFLSCPNLHFAGITDSYQLNQSQVLDVEKFEKYTDGLKRTVSNFNLENQCNKPCFCSKEHYEPICGKDGLMYYNPCFAGCEGESHHDGLIFYKNCSCISQNLKSIQADNPIFRDFHAINKMCDSKCDHLWLFLFLFFFVMFFTFLATMPALSATLRCVDDNIRSFALGIQWIVVRILGTIPAPIIFGRLIDESCILWEQDSCGYESGSCLLYDNKNMAKYMLLLALIGKLCSILFFFLSWFYYIPPKVSDIYQGDEKKREVYVKKESENEKY